MMQEAEDFWQETQTLANILRGLDDAGFDAKTQFKGWTINDVIGHLHIFNYAANLSLESGDRFDEFFGPIQAGLDAGKPLVETQYEWLGELCGRALFEAWLETSKETAENFASAHPKQRLRWAGPEMSARSFITARQMETWAHGQEIFDLLGEVRDDNDRIRNIAHLGVTAYGWTFVNRNMDVPEPAPYVKLTAPSGVNWEWNEPQDDNRVDGPAVGFCQIVTQTRNIADTDIQTKGQNAHQWMALAQCFAGKPEDPPAPGTRGVSG